MGARSNGKIYDSKRLSILETPEKGVGFMETKVQAKTHIEQENSEPTDVVRCIYCGAEINKLDSNNPYDNGLHPEYDKYTNISPRYTCGNCNIVTGINRILADMIHQDGTVYTNPKNIAYELREEAKWLEDHAEELSKYYLKQKNDRVNRRRE